TDTTTDALPLHVVDRLRLSGWRAGQSAANVAWLDAHAFDGAPGSALLLPGDDGASGAVIGVGDPLDPYSYGHAPFALPARAFRLVGEHDAAVVAALQLGWGLGAYRFSRYRQPPRAPATLQVEDDAEVRDALAACVRVRDL